MKSSAPACIRTGFCCETILLDVSPAQLRAAFRAWRDGKSGDSTVQRYDDSYLVYPMLEGMCRGKFRDPGKVLKYVYGPCKNLVHEIVGKRPDGKLVASCSIHADRPSLCKGYPYYTNTPQLHMGGSVEVSSPGYMKGCGYNADKTVGETTANVDANLIPLAENER